MLAQSILRRLIFAGVFALAATVSRGASEIVIAIRYLQPKGTSHSHLYLYREDGKLLRQLTNDNSGQDSDPIFSPNGETIVFAREKQNDTREFWSIDPRGTKLKKLDAASDWYSATKSSPYFTNLEQGEEHSSSASPAAAQEESGSPSATGESAERPEHPSVTALDAVADAQDRPPITIKAPDGSGEIFWRKGEDKEDPLDWIMWFRDSKSGEEAMIGKLRGFPSFEPLRIGKNKDGQFLFDGPLRLVFFSCHLNSSDGDTVEAFDFNKRKLVQLSPNWKIGTWKFPAVRKPRTVPTSNAGARLLKRSVTRSTNLRTAKASQKCVMRAKTALRSAMARRCIGLERILRSSPSAADRIRRSKP